MHLSPYHIFSTLTSFNRFLPFSTDDAGHLFDRMSPRKKCSSTPPASDVDHISALPDSILHHMLSFLPAQAVVQTCVLAQRWRHLWRSTTGLRIVGLAEDEKLNVKDLRKVVDHLLILRERTDLDTVEIKAAYFCEEDQPYVRTWVRFAVINKVRALSLTIDGSVDLCLGSLPLVSQYLRTLDLAGVVVQDLDFTSCPALEDLKMNNCNIGDYISSNFLKHLSISNCQSDLDCRVHVSTPGLISLELVGLVGRTPFLENMPLLETAYVDINYNCEDVCLKYHSGVSCGANDDECENCIPDNDDCSSDCVVLGGVSDAKHLKLISETGKFIFTRDLRHCPTFIKLRTLLLNEYWCEAPDLDPVACILKNSPVLEKLTLQLFSEGPNHKVEMKGRYSSMERPSAISEHLNIVEVKCSVVDERTLKVLKFLSAFNICFSF
ncbi:F-box/FBD/LRR-repeat protein At5g56420-like [Lolium rigidum]|uniref:F-box/FBD/LRR-repeat protein At5g56420-like n=1 Tax=Lolium rigidum TaxID=89674 RepID=UPI001F5D1F0D|nr:F-box/FBD/LRR-repeat protein At5g56420-like [Lolium rigidum]